jgi:hypothetical protein
MLKSGHILQHLWTLLPSRTYVRSRTLLIRRLCELRGSKEAFPSATDSNSFLLAPDSNTALCRLRDPSCDAARTRYGPQQPLSYHFPNALANRRRFIFRVVSRSKSPPALIRRLCDPCHHTARLPAYIYNFSSVCSHASISPLSSWSLYGCEGLPCEDKRDLLLTSLLRPRW